MLILAYVSQMLTSNFGQAWIVGGKLNVRFKTPARPGDTVEINGSIKKLVSDENGTSIKCDVLCQNQAGEIIINGDATLTV